MKYSPQGDLGVCRYVRAANYSSMNKFKYFESANKETIIIVHIEGVEGINNLDEILSVPGIDVIFIGPYDLKYMAFSVDVGIFYDISKTIVNKLKY